MQPDNDHEPPEDSPPSTARRGSLGRWMLAAPLLAASLAISACGSSGSPTILNTEKVEQAIQHSALSQRGARAQVSCPSGVHQKKGVIFVCTAVVGRTRTRFVVTEINGSGDVRYTGQ